MFFCNLFPPPGTSTCIDEIGGIHSPKMDGKTSILISKYRKKTKTAGESSSGS